MVPEAGALESNSYANTLYAKTPILPHKRFPLPPYRPRDGRGPQRDDWEHAIAQLCTAFGMAVAELDEEPPTPASSPFSVTPSDRNYTPFQPYDEQARLERWLMINTSIYYHVVITWHLLST